MGSLCEILAVTQQGNKGMEQFLEKCDTEAQAVLRKGLACGLKGRKSQLRFHL